MEWNKEMVHLNPISTYVTWSIPLLWTKSSCSSVADISSMLEKWHSGLNMTVLRTIESTYPAATRSYKLKRMNMGCGSRLKLTCTYKRWKMAEGSGSRYFPWTRITVGQSLLALTAIIRRTLGRIWWHEETDFNYPQETSEHKCVSEYTVDLKKKGTHQVKDG